MITNSTDLEQITNQICLPYTTITTNQQYYANVARQVKRAIAISTKRGSFLYMETISESWCLVIALELL